MKHVGVERGILIAALALLVGPSGLPTQTQGKTEKALAVPIYKPPKRGVPGRTMRGGSRGHATPGKAALTLAVLAPDHLGLTVHDQPTLFWYISEATHARVDLTLSDYREIGRPVTVTLPPVTNAGIHAVRLADYDIHLERGVPYEWTVTLVVNPHKRTEDVFASGGIKRIDAPAEVAAKLGQSTPRDMVFAFAEAGIWYDALAALSDAMSAAPKDPGLRLQRAALLAQVGLDEVAATERTQAGE